MRIGFFAYSGYSLKPYFDALKNQAHCTWVVFNWHLYRKLQSGGGGGGPIVFFNNPFRLKLRPFANRVVNKLCKWLRMQPERKTCELLAADADADVWLTDTTLMIHKMAEVRGPKVLVFHSVTYKEYILIPESAAYDLVLLPSEYFRRRMIEKFPGVDPEKLKVVGWPRNDIYFRPPYEREKTLGRLGLDPSRKTVMFAPTYDVFPGDRFFPEAWGGLEENFGALCRNMRDLGFNFIVKLHGASHAAIANRTLRGLAKKYGAVWHNRINTALLEDPRELLWASDILISDVSGIILDFLPLDRPVVYVDVAGESFWRKADLAREDRAGFCVKNMQELCAAVVEGLKNPHTHGPERERLRAKVFYRPEVPAARRAADVILDFVRHQKGEEGRFHA